MPMRASTRLLPALVAAATFTAFIPVLDNDFVNWGDRAELVENPHYRGVDPSHLEWMLTAVYMGHYQPLTWLSFTADYALWGMRPFGYHLTSLLLHVGCALAAYALLRRLLRIGSRAPPWAAALAAAAGALLFSLHPLRVETVAWAVERRGVLSGFLAIVSVLAYVSYAEPGGGQGRTASYWLSVTAFGLAILAKGAVVTLPLVLIVLDVYPLRRLVIRRQWPWPGAIDVLREKMPFFALASLGAIVALVGAAGSGVSRSWEGYGLLPRLGQCAWGLVFYLWKTIAPVDLSPLYEIPASMSSFAFAFLAAAVLVIGITAIALIAARRAPAVAAAWACWVILLLPVLGVLQAGHQIAADRYTYLPAVALGALAAAGLVAAAAHRRARPALLGAVPAVLTVLGMLTWHQAKVWSDSRTLWEHAVRIDPGGAVARNNLGMVEVDDGRFGAAIEAFRTAVVCNPGFADARVNLGGALASQGRLAEAIEQWEEVLRIDPAHPAARANLDRARSPSGPGP